MSETILTLYCVTDAAALLPDQISSSFAQVLSSCEYDSAQIHSNDWLVTAKMVDQTDVIFHVYTDPAILANHVETLISNFSVSPIANERLFEKIIRQIGIFNCAVTVTFARDADDERTDFIVDAIFEIAQFYSGYVLLPNGSLRWCDGRRFISEHGSDFDDSFEPLTHQTLQEKKSSIDIVPPVDALNETPHAQPKKDENRDPQEKQAAPDKTPSVEPLSNSLHIAAANSNKPAKLSQPTAEDKKRKEKTIAVLRARGIPYNDKINGIVRAMTTQRTTVEIAGRAIALLADAVCGESLCGGDSYQGAMQYYNMLSDRFGVITYYLSAREKEFFENEQSTPDVREQMSWRYECCAVMLWALGYIDLPYPSSICDVKQITQIILGQQNFSALIQNSRPLPFDTLLDQADLTLRYNWACITARANFAEEMPAKLDDEVVMERMEALDWLVGNHDAAEWDADYQAAAISN